MAIERCPFCNSETCSRKPVIGMHSRSEECFNGQIALLKSALHDLKDENERLKDQLHQLQYLVAAAKLEITGKEIVVEQANAKIAGLEQSAVMFRQIAELTKEEGNSIEIPNPNPDFEGPNYAVICRGDWVPNGDQLSGHYFYGDTLTEAIAAAFAAKEE